MPTSIRKLKNKTDRTQKGTVRHWQILQSSLSRLGQSGEARRIGNSDL